MKKKPSVDPSASRKEPGGLFAAGERVTLRGVAIDVRARGVAARIDVAQRYQNDEKKPVEAVYTFPLPEGCAVCGFEAEIGGKRLAGRVEEREKAFEEYDEAMARGHGAFLLDQDRPDIFTACVGNLLPGQEAVIRLGLLTELEQTGDLIRLTIPTTVSPRYVPPAMAKEMDPAELDHLMPPAVLGGVPYGLKLTAHLEAASDVRQVSCPSHPAQVTLEGRSARVELLGEDLQLDRDFVLEVALKEPHAPSAVVAREPDGTRVVMINLFPDLSHLRRGPCEFIFVIDRSGSMEGESISQAQKALQLCLRSMEKGDRFNIVGFGSKLETLFPESVAYSQKSLEEATRRVDAMEADLGGTELLAPLKIALESSALPDEGGSGETRMVVLLTDGEVANEEECIDLAAAHAARARIFAFGIGRGPSRHLIRGLARASGGQAEFIHPGERMEPKVLRQFARMASAQLKDLRLDWGGLECDLVAPSPLPPLFHGDRLTVYGRVKSGGPSEAAVEASGPGGRLRFPVSIDLEHAVADPAVPALLGRKAIEDLEEGRAEGARGSAQRHRRAKRTRERIVELARRYQLLSSETSYVAIEERAERGEGTQTEAAQLRRIPIALTKGWGGLESGLAGGLTGAAFLRAGAPQGLRSRSGLAGGMMADLMQGLTELSSEDPKERAVMRKSALPGFAHERAQAPPDDLDLLARAQRADGAFEPTKELLRLLGRKKKDLERMARELTAQGDVALEAAVTLAALVLLETTFADRYDEWRLLADKAWRWLGGRKIKPPAGFDSLEAWSKSVFPA